MKHDWLQIKQARPANRTGAVSLIELLVAMTAGSAITLAGAHLVHKSLTLHSEMSRQVAHARAVDQFAMDLRQELKLHETAKVTENQLTLNGPRSQVRYEFEGARISKSASKASSSDQNGGEVKTYREQFQLYEFFDESTQLDCVFAVEERQVSATLSWGLPGDQIPQRRIKGVLGVRLASQTGNPEANQKTKASEQEVQAEVDSPEEIEVQP